MFSLVNTSIVLTSTTKKKKKVNSYEFSQLYFPVMMLYLVIFLATLTFSIKEEKALTVYHFRDLR